MVIIPFPSTILSLSVTLHSRGFQLGADGSEDLAQALSTNDTVLEVILWVNHIGDRVRPSSNDNCLQSNALRVQGATALAPVLASHPKLVKLDLFDNDISDSGAIALASVISKSKTLKELNLLSNMIGDEGNNSTPHRSNEISVIAFGSFHHSQSAWFHRTLNI